MVDLFMDAGFTYFDTVFVYPGSEAAGEGHRASDCISCRQCEKACPQHLPVTDHLKAAAEMLEGQ